MGYTLNGVNTGGLPMYLIERILAKHHVDYFVETGTASGESVRLAAQHFKKCYTVEVIEGRPVREDAPINIVFFTGDSSEILTVIIDELLIEKSGKERQWVLFWLDAHYSGDKPNETEFLECPLINEINAVATYGEDAIIFIDDARLFLGHPPYPNNPTQWPNIHDIFILLREKFPYHYSTITDDYILCIPIHIREIIDEEWRERFHIRYPNKEDKLKSQVKDVYNSFKKYIE